MTVARRDSNPPDEARYCLEHRAPDGRGRVLDRNAGAGLAFAAALAWAETLRRAGGRGTVAVVDERTGRTVWTEPIDPA